MAVNAKRAAVIAVSILGLLIVLKVVFLKSAVSLTQFTASANISPEIPLKDVPSLTQFTESANISLQELATSLVVVTGISDNHFEEAMDMIGSVHHFLPDTKIIVYDLGLSKSHLQALHCIENIEVRHYNFPKYPDFGKTYGLGGYTWKVYT